MKIRPLVLLALVLVATTAWSAPVDWKLDKAHSGVYFDVTHILSTARGHFDDFDATLSLDPENLPASSVFFTVKTKSVNTYNRKRDGHLRSAELLDAKQHPEIRFMSRKIRHLSGKRYEVEGDLTLHGTTKTVRVPFTFHGVKPNPFKKGGEVIGVTATFPIDRLAYGVGNGKFLELGVIGREVLLTVSLEATR